MITCILAELQHNAYIILCVLIGEKNPNPNKLLELNYIKDVLHNGFIRWTWPDLGKEDQAPQLWMAWNQGWNRYPQLSRHPMFIILSVKTCISKIFLLVSEPLVHTHFILSSILPHFFTWTKGYNFIARSGTSRRAGKNSNYRMIPNKMKRAGPTCTDFPNSLTSLSGDRLNWKVCLEAFLFLFH